MDSVKWYYLDAGQQRGPTDTKNLKDLLSAGELPPGAMVWTTTLTDWQPANTIGILKSNRVPKTLHWLNAFLLVFVSALGLGFGGKYLIDKKNQTNLAAPMIVGKRITDPYRNEASLLLPSGHVRDSQEKEESPGKSRRTHEAKSDQPIIKTADPDPAASDREEPIKKIIGNLQAENEALTKQVMELKATQGDPLAKTKLLRATQQLNQLKENYTESERQNRLLQTKLRLEQQQPESELIVQGQKDMAKIQSELAKKTQRVELLEKQLGKLRASLSKMQNIGLPKLTAPAVHVGHIADVHINERLLVLNLTTTNRLSVGKTIHITSKASGENLGKAMVSRVSGSKCVAKFEGENISRLTLGDHVLSRVGQ